MTGKTLKEAIWESGIKIKTIAKESGIPEQTLYSLYRKSKVEEFHLKKLYKVDGLRKFLPDSYSNDYTAEVVEEPEVRYAPSEQVWVSAIEAITRAMDVLSEESRSLIESNQTLNRIVNEALNKGLFGKQGTDKTGRTI